MPRLLPGTHEVKLLHLVVSETGLAYLEYEITEGESKGVKIKHHLDRFTAIEQYPTDFMKWRGLHG